ncbi:MAG: hypothetical protein GTO45_18550 [Candidatus Aminicenantes bacterium]|nr:hypothetical protein [Candidatus Aminicenantes bacterium]NIM80789.1 hypothetical protein [Candidatus Aminicenantes bacterium]NIN20172.1 hypothetical protein [Candidatus Aminicenantes bacterium]NIN43951.1 hypothetical protein [Candidatus Aminicenantes bacterium]NIN86760.1 hypothetical protein [Candidatus Aminicenantes bacterium]
MKGTKGANGVRAFFKSIAFRNISPAVYAWFFNFLFSLIIYFGCYRVFCAAAGKSTIAADVYGQIGVFTFLTDIVRNYKGNLLLVFSIALLSAFLFFLVSIYVSGGIYSVLVEEERTTFVNLTASSSENFPNMLKIFLACILVWVVALLIPGMLLLIFLKLKSLGFNETAIRLFSYLWIGITALLITFSTAVYDFARIFKLKDDKNLLQTFRKAIRFTFSNKLNILVIFLLYAVSLVIFYLVYMVFAGLVEHLLYVSLIFIFYQGFIMVRYFLKVVAMHAEIKLIQYGG